MTVSTVVDHNDYVGNGVTTSFPYTFRIFKKSDLVVKVIDLDENLTVLTPDSDYTITNAGSYAGGNVVLTDPLVSGWKISIARELEPTQETDLRNQGKFYAEVHEDAFDKLTMLIQQTYSAYRLALRKPSAIANWYDALNNYIRNVRDPRDPQDAATKSYVDSLASGNLVRTLRVPEPINQLPNATERANKMPAFDSFGDAIVVLPPSGSASDVLIELAKPTGSGLIGYGNKTVQEALDLISARSDQFATLKEWAEFDAPVKVFVAGDYTLDETLYIKCDELTTTGRVNVTMTQPTPFIVVGSADQTEIVSSTTTVIQRGANNLTVPAGSDVKIGDVLFIWNPVNYSFSPWRAYLRQGEAVTVADVGTTNIILTGKIFDQYPVGTKIIKPVMQKKRISGDFFVTFPQLTGTHTYSPNSVGMLAIQLLDSDFTGFSMKTKQASQAFIVRRCLNCHGKGMNNSQAIFGDATLGLDSGLGMANSQGCRFEGRFSGERHGVSVSGNGEPGSIPCRFNVIGGEILSTSKDSKTAGDWHGGCEYNYYYGRIMGVTAGGNHNGVLPGSVVESLGYPTTTNATEPTIGFREMDGCDFMFSGITVRSQGKPSTAFKGIVDCGSISSILNSDVKAGGTINFSGTTFECEDTEYVFKIRSTDFNLKWGVNLSDVVIKSAGNRPIWIAANSGKEADWVNMNGIQFNSNCTDPIINTVSPSMNYTRSGRTTATIAAGSSSVQIVVTLDTALPAKYYVNAIALGNYPKPIVISNDQRQAGQFRLTLKTGDGANAAAAIVVDIGYTVIL